MPAPARVARSDEPRSRLTIGTTKRKYAFGLRPQPIEDQSPERWGEPVREPPAQVRGAARAHDDHPAVPREPRKLVTLAAHSAHPIGPPEAAEPKRDAGRVHPIVHVTTATLHPIALARDRRVANGAAQHLLLGDSRIAERVRA